MGEVIRYDALTGAFIDILVEEGSGGPGEPTFIIFAPQVVPESGTLTLYCSARLHLQCLSFTALRVAVFSSDSPVSEGRQLNTTSPVPGSRNSSNPVSICGTKLSM